MYPILPFAAVGIAIIAELLLVLLALPNGIHAANVHPEQLVSNRLNGLSLTTANEAIAAALFVIISIVAVRLLANQSQIQKPGVMSVVLLALFALAQLAGAQQIEDTLLLPQPTGKMLIDEFRLLQIPALGILAVIAVFLILYAWARKAKVLHP